MEGECSAWWYVEIIVVTEIYEACVSLECEVKDPVTVPLTVVPDRTDFERNYFSCFVVK
jgi:hypothetical protein